MKPENASAAQTNSIWETLLIFLRLGATAFGGPAAHIAIMQDEFVKRRKWLDDQHFLDLIGITNLIPGPNSTEMAIHLGYLRAGLPGLLAAGIGFIFPAFSTVLILAWLYGLYGTTPQANWLLYGIKPVVIAIIIQALWKLGKKALKTPLLAALAVLVIAGSFLGIKEIPLLFGGGILIALIQNISRLKIKDSAAGALLIPGVSTGLLASTTFSYGTLFFTFLKIGAVLYGSGYVLLAFLHSEFIVNLGWITEQQLLDAVAIGQLTPGPLFTTATFLGYIMGGVKGALLASIGIFLPSFVFVALSQKLFMKIKDNPIVRSLLDGVNAAAVGLMAVVSWQLGVNAITDPLTIGITLVCLVLLFRTKINATWLILGGAAIGVLQALF